MRLKRSFSTDAALLQGLATLLARLRSTTSSTQKTCILRDAPTDTRQFLLNYLQLGPLHLGKASLERFKGDTDPQAMPLLDLLSSLADRTLSGHRAASAVHAYIHSYPEHKHLVVSLLERDLEVRMSFAKMKEILNVNDDLKWPGVALAEVFDQEVLLSHDWYASRKLDGVRCLAHHDGTSVKLYSRTKLLIDGPQLVEIKEALRKDLPAGCWLDGELCWFPEEPTDDAKESFKETMQRIRRISEIDSQGKLVYLAFDHLSNPEEVFSKRLVTLRNLNLRPPLYHLPQIKLHGSDELTALWRKAQAKGWEGLMLRRDVAHRPTRSNDLLKLKAWQDAEYPIVDYCLTRMRTVFNGREEWEEGLLGALVIKHKGDLVNVGSGFTLTERRELAKLGDDLLGRLITVAYFGESMTDGKHSLRFPIFKALHERGHRLL